MSDQLFDPASIPSAPVITPAVSASEAAPKPKRKSYYVPVSKRVAADNKTAVARAQKRKAEKKAVRAGKVVSKKVTVSPAKKAETKELKEILKQDTATKGSSKSDICSICHKPLSKHTSVQNGMGDTCANKIKLLAPGTTLEDHYAKIMVDEIPEGYLKLKDAINKLKEKGISTYRIVQAIGGDRMLRKPLNGNFKVVIYMGTRYINGASVKNWKDLLKV